MPCLYPLNYTINDLEHEKITPTMKGLFITGTDTNIGKTWISVSLISALKRLGLDVSPRKPIESGWDNDNIESTDAWLLANAANKLNDLDDICPNRFTYAVSPVRAALLESKQLSLKKIQQDCLKNTKTTDFLIIEGAGGFYSPLCTDGLNADLASKLKLPILLIADNRLGCINQVLLNVEAIEKRGLLLKAIVLNDVANNDSNNMNNLEDLKGYLSYPIITILHNQKSKESFDLLATIVS